MATGAISKLLDCGYSIPKDVSIIGFDDVLLAKYCVPGLSTVNYPIEVMAVKATDLALKLAQNEPVKSEGYLYKPFVVKRDSVVKL